MTSASQAASAAELTPEQRAAIEARRLERQTPEYQAALARDIEAIQREYPPARPDADLLEALSSPAPSGTARG